MPAILVRRDSYSLASSGLPCSHSLFVPGAPRTSRSSFYATNSRFCDDKPIAQRSTTTTRPCSSHRRPINATMPREIGPLRRTDQRIPKRSLTRHDAVFGPHTLQRPRDHRAARLVTDYIARYNDHRPHRSLDQHPPRPAIVDDPANTPESALQVARTSRCNGLINEYRNEA